MAKGTRGAGGRSDEVLIKKYGNRRLYDTSQSQYITLDDLAEIVKQGAKIRVVEASSDRDLTRQVLIQVILEQQEALDMFPVELLHAAIRVRGTLDQAPFTALLSTMTRQMSQASDAWTSQLSTLFGGIPGAPGTTPRDPETGEPPAPEATGESAPPPDDSQEEPAPNPPAEPADKPLDDIRNRMDRLLGKLGKS